jgi:glutamate-1-semialdehyde 2,1-aminomutase
MWGFFFSATPVTDFASAKRSDAKLFARFFHRCLNEGVYLPPSAFESCFAATAHDAAVVEWTGEAFARAFKGLEATAPTPTASG